MTHSQEYSQRNTKNVCWPFFAGIWADKYPNQSRHQQIDEFCHVSIMIQEIMTTVYIFLVRLILFLPYEEKARGLVDMSFVYHHSTHNKATQKIQQKTAILSISEQRDPW